MRFDSKNAHEHHSRLARSRELRKDMSPPEVKLWNRVRAGRLGGLKFRRQHRIGPYIADFYCAAATLVVELDGQRHDPDHDATRDAYMQSLRIEVLRIPVSRFEQNEEAAFEMIWRTATTLIAARRSDTPSPASKTRPPLPADGARLET